MKNREVAGVLRELDQMGLFSLSGPMRTLWKSKGPAERAQEVRDLAAYAKKYVSTPAFEKMYNEWIKATYHAVDHGLRRFGGPGPGASFRCARG